MAFSFREGTLPLLISFPHSSTFVPEALQTRFSEQGRSVPDTDWFLPQLYQVDIEDETNPTWHASILQAEFSRYVIDPNRPVDGTNLYPGQPTPALCPVSCFDGSPIYELGEEPSDQEIDERRRTYWQPYHDMIRSELARMKQQFGLAVLFDAHSILSQVPRLFEGHLPNINMGTYAGRTITPDLESNIQAVLQSQTNYSHVFNGRFLGGFITRNYGDPANQIYTIQLELTQESYMNEVTGEYDPERAARVRPVLFGILKEIEAWIQQQTQRT